jgi:hypothetical protein
MNRRDDGKDGGSVLVMAVVLAFGIFLLGLTYLGFVDRVILDTDDLITRRQAIYAAGAAVMDAAAYAAQFDPGTDHHMKKVKFYSNVEYEAHLDFTGYTGWDYSVVADYVAVGIGTARSYSGVETRYQVSGGVKHETFADYLYLTVDEHDLVWGHQIYFWTPDTLDGKVHTNDVIHIHPSQDRPVFRKRVTSSASYIYPPDNHARFDEGLYLNQPEIIFPDRAEEVRFYAGPRYTFGSNHPDSVYWLAFLGNVFKVNRSGNRGNTWEDPTWVNLPFWELPPSGAIYVNGKCWISTTIDPDNPVPGEGGLDGRVTVASSDTMYIRGQTLYACFDNVNNIVPRYCDDALGLISEKWVLVSDRLPSWHFGIKINAGIAALRGSFSVDRIYGNAREHQSLFVYGSIAQFHRGIVHTGPCGGGNGYCQKDYKYDTRFQKNPPPHFISIEDRKPVYYEGFYII